ncbi:hypothetical protein CAXC1_330108 [Candidatus Xenohaliotis californiensis]|uniref:Uncharacterized protein n=1 Tax=Candidatus Xenohaliotis californiensis TaxID=84677 RepID=A0ABM9N8U5_9RICK|nr:hypothetical protein CAXC1_330108 [Candidatus Xenohaliotis californiensis]
MIKKLENEPTEDSNARSSSIKACGNVQNNVSILSTGCITINDKIGKKVSSLYLVLMLFKGVLGVSAGISFGAKIIEDGLGGDVKLYVKQRG